MNNMFHTSTLDSYHVYHTSFQPIKNHRSGSRQNFGTQTNQPIKSPSDQSYNDSYMPASSVFCQGITNKDLSAQKQEKKVHT